MPKAKILKEVEEVILSRSPARVAKVFSKLDVGSVSTEEIHGAMTAGMEKARKKLKQGECSIPEFLLIIDAFRQGVIVIQQQQLEIAGSVVHALQRPLVQIGQFAHDIRQQIAALALLTDHVIDPVRQFDGTTCTDHATERTMRFSGAHGCVDPV